jgi:dephospho-CoA kinase
LNVIKPFKRHSSLRAGTSRCPYKIAMLKVGLTGSIAVGKSYVCEVLRELGAFVLDADQTAREVVAPGSKGLALIIEKFGREALTETGELDRARMSAIVFGDEAKRQLLNSIVHPLVIEAQNEWLAEKERENPRGLAVIDAALMIESNGYKRFTKLIVVWCEPQIQLQRLMLRNNLSEAEARKRIEAQMPQEEKKRYADFLIDTSAGFENTRQQTIEVFEQLKLLVN